MSKNLLLVIDMQKDFCDPSGSLYVQGGEEAAENLANFISHRTERFDHIILTQDCHFPTHIGMHSSWTDENGNDLVPFMSVTSGGIERGMFNPKYVTREYAIEYVKAIGGVHTVWPLHCLNGCDGIQFPEVIKTALIEYCARTGKPYEVLSKGQKNNVEMYSVLSYFDINLGKKWINSTLVKTLSSYNKIYIAGLAKDFCVYSTVKDLLEHEAGLFKDRLVFLNSCMASIDPGNVVIKNFYNEAVEKYGAINM